MEDLSPHGSPRGVDDAVGHCIMAIIEAIAAHGEVGHGQRADIGPIMLNPATGVVTVHWTLTRSDGSAASRVSSWSLPLRSTRPAA